jgi:hypothetical protein
VLCGVGVIEHVFGREPSAKRRVTLQTDPILLLIVAVIAFAVDGRRVGRRLGQSGLNVRALVFGLNLSALRAGHIHGARRGAVFRSRHVCGDDG